MGRRESVDERNCVNHFLQSKLDAHSLFAFLEITELVANN